VCLQLTPLIDASGPHTGLSGRRSGQRAPRSASVLHAAWQHSHRWLARPGTASALCSFSRWLTRTQDTTDLQKCLALLAAHPVASQPAALRVAVCGALGGRLDHELAALSALHAFPSLRVTLVNDACTVQLLPPGRHRLLPLRAVEGPLCGLVPLGALPCCCSKLG